MIRLKITIPTYNRPEHIQRQVRDLLPQLREGVQLVVIDNCSTVPVATYFTDEEKTHFTLMRNKFNVGGAANIGKCLAENGESGWIWLLGDDDKITENAVETILDVIEKHQDCCYINFQQKKTQLTTEYREFLDYLTIIGAFGISFFQSACLFNMDKLRPYVMCYYDYLSCMCSQIIMVIKYLEAHPDEHCLFTSTRILQGGSPGGWSHVDLIINSSMLIDRFRYCKRIMRPTMFKALGNLYFTSLTAENVTYRERWKYSKFVVKKLGLLSVLRYNFLTTLGCFTSLIMPKSLFIRIRLAIASRYNSGLG